MLIGSADHREPGAVSPSLVRGWRFCDPYDMFPPEWRPEAWRGVPILRYAFPNMALDGSAREPPGRDGPVHVDSDGVTHWPPPWQGPPPNDEDLPDLLLVDDLSGNPAFADAAARRAFVRELHALRSMPACRTVIYATREGDDALAVSDQIAVLDGGQIVQCGTPAEVYDAPVNEDVARLFGRPPAPRPSRRWKLRTSGITSTSMRRDRVRLSHGPTDGSWQSGRRTQMIDRWSTPVWKFADGHIETLERVPVGQAPFAESDLRDLLAQKASLLPVRHFDPVFALPVCLGTEFPVPGVGRIDAIFLSPSGYVTIVETKLWQNPEARREVVAQIIDYAQQIARWTYADLESRFNDCQKAAGRPSSSLFSHVCDLEDDAASEAEFTDAVNRCLGNGRFLLLVIGDGIREGVERMTEFLQRTPLLQYTLGLVEMSCYRHRDPAGGVLVIPQVIARTAEVTRAVVHIDLHGGNKGDVTVTAEVPDDSQPARAHHANHLSEAEFYALLVDATSPDTAQQYQAFVEGLVTAHETLEVTCTPNRLQIRVQPPERGLFTALSVTTTGDVRTSKGWVDFLKENHPRALESFLDGLSSIDPRLRPLEKKSGVFSVPKAKSTTCDLGSIMPKLDELAQVVAKAVEAAEAGSPE